MSKAAVVATSTLPRDLTVRLEEAAESWIASPARPQPTADALAYWEDLVGSWVRTPEYPLFIRKSGPRGFERRHPSGRTVVCVDNSPAHWTFASALAGERPTAGQLLDAALTGEWPVMFARTKVEASLGASRFQGLLGRSKRAKLLNDADWKVCHIEDVGLRGRGAAETFPLAMLEEHCRRLLSPSNMFLVPNSHAGFGELPEVVDAFRRAMRGLVGGGEG